MAKKPPDFSADFSETPLTSELVHEGKFLKVYRDTVRMPDGATAWREYVKHPGAVMVLAFLLIVRIVHSPFGQVLIAIKENEPRAISLGYDTNRFKLLAFILSAGLAGLAGSLKVVVLGFETLGDAYWTMSGLVVLMTLVGGMGTLFGPLLGAALIVAVGTHATMVEFLDKGRRGMASTFLTRLRLGPALVDAKGVSHLYEGRIRRRDMVFLVASALAAMVAMTYASHSLHVFFDGFRLMFSDAWQRVTNWF